MMYYHMNQDDRKEFTNTSKPTGLPSGLADNLPTNLQKFFYDKYAPAFLCRSIESFDKYSAQFTPKEREKLWYWWEGNGDKCLSRTQEYNDLNNITSIEAMKMLYKNDLDPFYNSSKTPDEWANELYGKLGNKRIMNQFLTNPIQNVSYLSVDSLPSRCLLKALDTLTIIYCTGKQRRKQGMRSHEYTGPVPEVC